MPIRVRAEVGTVFNPLTGKYQTQNDEFELPDELAEELISYGAVTRLDKKPAVKRGPGRPRKTES